MFQVGWFKTKSGMNAKIAQVKSEKGKWFFLGGILFEGVYYLHVWDFHGVSISANRGHDLVENKNAE